MDIAVFIERGGVTEFITFRGASEARFEEANDNNAKPAMLVIYTNTGEDSDWGSAEVLGEICADDVVGWVKSENLKETGALPVGKP